MIKGANYMISITIESLIIPYKTELLDKWKDRDTEIVPSFMLEWQGPGISNGYAFGEWAAEKLYRDQGYYVFNDSFDLISKRSKYDQFNKMIRSLVAIDQLNRFSKLVKLNLQSGYSIENLDLFVFNEKEYFFVEVKKGKDRLRDPQLRFMYLVKEALDIESKMMYFVINLLRKK